MNSRHFLRCLLLAVVLVFAPSARAHPGHYHPGADEVDEFEKQHALYAGFLHPFSSLDHLLALLAIGCAAGLAVNPRSLVTGAFVSSLLVGGAAAIEGFVMPELPAVAAICVLAAGLTIALPRRSSRLMTTIIAAAFGLWQGNAHALMIPTHSLLLPYSFGFITTSTVLLLAGIVLGRQLNRRTRSRPVCLAPSV